MNRAICLRAALVAMCLAGATLSGCARSVYLGTGYSSYRTYGYGQCGYGTFTSPHHHGHHAYKYKGHYGHHGHGHHHGGYHGGGYCDH